MNEGCTHSRSTIASQKSGWKADGKELRQRHRLATNEVVNVTRRHSLPGVFETFYSNYHSAVGHVATLAVPNLEEVAA
jgi:hypothetical protein